MTEEVIKEEKKQLSEEEISELKYAKMEKQKQAIDRVIKGVNDVWTKEYDFEEIGLKFKISIKAPNALQQANIQVRRERYLEGMGSLVPQETYIAFHTLATIREVGVDIPVELEKDEDIYNTAILVIIGRDFQEWLNSFRY